MTLYAFASQYPILQKHEEMLLNAGFEGDIDPFKVVAYFIKKGDLEPIKELIDAGYDINSAEKGDFGSSLLHNAIRYDQMDIFHYLIDNGADINFVDAVGWTPLMEAIIDNRPAYGKILVDSGCNQDIVNKRGVNAKMMAQKFGKHEFLVFFD
jgi:ankyrin repeat protein